MVARGTRWRLARLGRKDISFGAAVALGIGLGYVQPRKRHRPSYDGAGQDGDLEAIGIDFSAALGKCWSAAQKRA